MRLAAVLAALLAAGASRAAEPAASGGNEQGGRVNVLLIHCHDLGQHLHCYGIQTVRTPHLDALATEGVRFSRSFCTNPGCSPSRASIFTGRYPHSNGVMGLTHAQFGWDLNPAERHLGQILRDAGFATAAVGIIHETGSGPRRCGYQVYRARASPSRPPLAIEELKRLEKERANRSYSLWGSSSRTAWVIAMRLLRRRPGRPRRRRLSRTAPRPGQDARRAGSRLSARHGGNAA